MQAKFNGFILYAENSKSSGKFFVVANIMIRLRFWASAKFSVLKILEKKENCDILIIGKIVKIYKKELN